MIIFLILILLASPVHAQEPKLYELKVLKVVDGDTLQVHSELLPEKLKLAVRVYGIDTPEKAPRSKCPEENALGQKATALTKQLVEVAQKNNQKILFDIIKWYKYGGRIDAKVFINNINLGDELIKRKLARAYFGEKKKSWCD